LPSARHTHAPATPHKRNGAPVPRFPPPESFPARSAGETAFPFAPFYSAFIQYRKESDRIEPLRRVALSSIPAVAMDRNFGIFLLTDLFWTGGE
jgi:hypothetical protein